MPGEDPPAHPHETLEDFFENSLNGCAIAKPDGTILRANARLARWLGKDAADLVGTRFADYLTVGGRVLYATHLSPLLRMQGFFSEIALELSCAGATRLPVFVNALERRNDAGTPLSVHLTLFKGEERRQFEQNLQQARDLAEGNLSDERQTSDLREQFIAVLGHDLRNPLGAITMGTALLRESDLDEGLLGLVGMMEQSAARMSDLIADVMDFARGRLGGGITLARKQVLLEPVLTHVVAELAARRTGATIRAEIQIPTPVDCDPTRLSQLLSNLLANALVHGEPGADVFVRGRIRAGSLELSVSNSGPPILPDAIERLFQPFTRDEVRPSAQGLGLGLYIVHQIAKAHGATMAVTSTLQETRFTFSMPLASR